MREQKLTKEYLCASAQIKQLYNLMFSRTAEECGLGMAGADVLLFLINDPEHDTAREIVKYRNISKAYVSKAVLTLIERGYLTAETDRTDRRLQHLRVTPAAGGVIEKLRQTQRLYYESISAGLSEETIDRFMDIMEKIIRNTQTALEAIDERMEKG